MPTQYNVHTSTQHFSCQTFNIQILNSCIFSHFCIFSNFSLEFHIYKKLFLHMRLFPGFSIFVCLVLFGKIFLFLFGKILLFSSIIYRWMPYSSKMLRAIFFSLFLLKEKWNRKNLFILFSTFMFSYGWPFNRIGRKKNIENFFNAGPCEKRCFRALYYFTLRLKPWKISNWIVSSFMSLGFSFFSVNCRI